jgi:CHAD domain-containing protein
VAVATIEYLPAADFDLSMIGRSLPAPLQLADPEPLTTRHVYYDTFDERLRAKGLQLVHDGTLLVLLSSNGEQLAAAQANGAAELIRPSELPPGSLRDRVVPICDVRVILRVAEVESSGQTFAVLDEEDKTVARIVAETSVLRGGARDGDALRKRLHVRGVRGYDKVVQRVKSVLEDALELVPATETLADELRARAQSAPSPVAADARSRLTPEMPADRAAVAICVPLLHTIEANLPGTLGDLDSEFLHDLRVAVRRTRSLQRELKRVFPADELAHFREEFRWLQQVTGPSRDLDVYLLEFGDFAAELAERQRSDLNALRAVLEEHRAAERVLMEDALRSARTERMLRDWSAFLERLPSLPIHDRQEAVMGIEELASRRIRRVYRQMVRMGSAIGEESPAESLHDLRKKGKELRYLLEFFSPLYPGKVTKPMVKRLKALQDTLGRFQDREVQAAMIRGLRTELIGRSDGSAALMAMGVLVERLDEHQRDARAEFAERFGDFAAAEQQAVVKETFR